MLGIQRAGAEIGNSIPVDHILEVFKLPDVDLLDLVRGAEAVEEVKYRDSALDSGKMRYRAKIHYFLLVGLAKHCVTGLTTGINVGMIAEYIKCVRGNAARRNVDNAGKQLACHLVHIGDHKKQTLRSGICRGKRARGKRTVYCARGACLGLHFNELYSFTEYVARGLAEQVLIGGRPCVGDLSHGA